jgi:ABC-type phosphate transport system substrate-binding protein
MRPLPLAAVAATLLALETAPATRANGELPLAIIVNKSNPTEAVSLAELRQLFLGRRQHWPGGRRVTPVMRAPGPPERQAVLSRIYRMSESDYRRYYLHAGFTGEVSDRPKEVSTAAAMRKFVAYVPGAIGYVRAEELDDTVKAVRVEGKAPGEAGYPVTLPEAR